MSKVTKQILSSDYSSIFLRFHSSFLLLKCFVKFLSWNRSFQVAKHVVMNVKVIVNVIQSNSVIGEGTVFAKRGERIVAVCFCVALQLSPHSFNWVHLRMKLG